MELIGHGVYLLKKQMPHSPEELTIDPTCLDDGVMGQMAARVIKFSKRHNAWVGVHWPTLLDDIRSELPPAVSVLHVHALRHMIRSGYLEIPGNRRWLGALNALFRLQIVCPTALLVSVIWGNQREATDIRGLQSSLGL